MNLNEGDILFQEFGLFAVTHKEKTMLQFHVDQDICIQCGECVSDCPYSIIQMVDGYPAISEEKAGQCIECQHCFAVCEPGALSVFGLNPDKSTPLKGNLPDPAKIETLMMGRRSVRRYKEEPVESGVIDRIMEVVRSAPTGVNNGGVLYTLVEDPAVMAELRERTYDGLRKVVEDDALPPGKEFFGGISNAWDNGVDILYRGAPHFIVASVPAAGPSPMADALIGLTYFELLASSHGLGVVWNGLAKWALLDLVPEAGAMLGIPEDHVVGYMMSFGKPAVRYHRTVQRVGGTVRRLTI